MCDLHNATESEKRTAQAIFEQQQEGSSAPPPAAEHLTAEAFEAYVLGENVFPSFAYLHNDTA